MERLDGATLRQPTAPAAETRQTHAAPADLRKPHATGSHTRKRLLLVALKLFGERGYANTSTRAIAQAARVNIASISYYFDSKEGLYCAALDQLVSASRLDVSAFTAPGQPIGTLLHDLFSSLLAPLRKGRTAGFAVRLCLHELIAPTPMCRDKIAPVIRDIHQALVGVLCSHLGPSAAHEDVSRLAFTILGMALQPVMMRDVIDGIHPGLLQSDAALDTWITRMVEGSTAMIAAEQRRLASSAAR
ncbi:TetR/AcrR family transcriptional regulator [Massilia aquatica]|nr:TetR/AcrR family transcriptional regulator [Massilia aquatica]